jgi:hypothetical protein
MYLPLDLPREMFSEYVFLWKYVDKSVGEGHFLERNCLDRWKNNMWLITKYFLKQSTLVDL